MRVVLDTNVIVRAVAAPDGPAAELLEHLRPPHVLILSSVMLDELERVLRYSHVRQMHSRDEAELDQFITSLRSGSVVVSTPPEAVPALVPDDRDDDFVIAAAVAGGADVLCTRDRHLQAAGVRQYCADRGIRIVTDVELLDELRASETEE